MGNGQMTQRREKIEAFVRHLVAEVEAAEAEGIVAPQAIADHFNGKRLTTRKGRGWTAATVAKFLSSPGVKRYRTGGIVGHGGDRAADRDTLPRVLDNGQLRRITETTIGHYDRAAEAYRLGTLNHDVSQNRAALLEAMQGKPPYSILDLGCGPGRDVLYFRSLGHEVVGLDGSAEFVAMTRRYTGCDVLHQDFLALNLPAARFDGVFANASLFHVPGQELPRVLRDIAAALKAGGVLFCSNPRGNNQEDWNGDRYGCFWDLATWRDCLTAAGFTEIRHYYRPSDRPRHQQPWLVTVWRKA